MHCKYLPINHVFSVHSFFGLRDYKNNLLRIYRIRVNGMVWYGMARAQEDSYKKCSFLVSKKQLIRIAYTFASGNALTRPIAMDNETTKNTIHKIVVQRRKQGWLGADY